MQKYQVSFLINNKHKVRMINAEDREDAEKKIRSGYPNAEISNLTVRWTYTKMERQLLLYHLLRYAWYPLNMKTFEYRNIRVDVRTLQRDFELLTTIGYEIVYDEVYRTHTIDFPEDDMDF